MTLFILLFSETVIKLTTRNTVVLRHSTRFAYPRSGSGRCRRHGTLYSRRDQGRSQVAGSGKYPPVPILHSAELLLSAWCTRPYCRSCRDLFPSNSCSWVQSGHSPPCWHIQPACRSSHSMDPTICKPLLQRGFPSSSAAVMLADTAHTHICHASEPPSFPVLPEYKGKQGNYPQRGGGNKSHQIHSYFWAD